MSREGGIVASAVCYTDAMDATLAKRIEELLTGCNYGSGALCARCIGDANDREVRG